MSQQIYEEKSGRIRERFLEAKKKDPQAFERKMDLSWSIWMFGTESFEESLARLSRNGLRFVELKGDHQTKESGLPPKGILRALEGFGMEVSGTCGMFGTENDLSSPSAYSRQNAVDYIRRELAVLEETGGRYLIVVPSAVGRPEAVDPYERIRSAGSLARCAGDFARSGILAALEPIRSAEVSLVNSIDDALSFLGSVGSESIAHINADTYHMSLEEPHIGEAILKAGDRLANLHLADTNRDGLGRGMLDLDTVIMAAYLIGMNREGRFLTPEPLGPVTDPYQLSNMPCDTAVMDALVSDTVSYFRQREDYVRSL